MSKYNEITEDPGNKLNEVSGRLIGVGADTVGTVTSDWKVGARPNAFRTMSVIDDPPLRPNRGFIKAPVHARGFLESVLIVQLGGTSTDFSVVFLDRIQEGNYPPNWIWRSATVVTVPGETGVVSPYPYGSYQYGYSYTTYTDSNFKMIYAYGIMAAYENRTTYEHDASEFYFKVIPDGASTDNDYSVKFSTIALA